MQKYWFKDSHNLHKNINKKINSKIRINKEDIDPAKTTQSDRSLRTIVKKKITQLNINNEEKTLGMLTGGP